MKSLNQILAATSRDRKTLEEALPIITDRLSILMAESIGIDGFFFPDLMEALSTEYYQFSSTKVREVLNEQGWVSICRMIPGRKDRVQVFVKKIRCTND